MPQLTNTLQAGEHRNATLHDVTNTAYYSGSWQSAVHTAKPTVMREMGRVRRVSKGDIKRKAVLQKLTQYMANMTKMEDRMKAAQGVHAECQGEEQGGANIP